MATAIKNSSSAFSSAMDSFTLPDSCSVSLACSRSALKSSAPLRHSAEFSPFSVSVVPACRGSVPAYRQFNQISKRESDSLVQHLAHVLAPQRIVDW